MSYRRRNKRQEENRIERDTAATGSPHNTFGRTLSVVCGSGGGMLMWCSVGFLPVSDLVNFVASAISAVIHFRWFSRDGQRERGQKDKVPGTKAFAHENGEMKD